MIALPQQPTPADLGNLDQGRASGIGVRLRQATPIALTRFRTEFQLLTSRLLIVVLKNFLLKNFLLKEAQMIMDCCHIRSAQFQPLLQFLQLQPILS
ncbi:MAG: hypothetical protein ACKOPS_02615 [Cyanobium sp.]